MKRIFSLRRTLLFLVVILWMVPISIIYIFMTVSYRNDIIGKTTALMEEGLKNFTYFNAQRIDEAIDISKKISYEQVIEKAWWEYAKGMMSKAELYRQITGNLTSKFYNDNRFEIAVFYLSEEPEEIYYTKQKESNYIDIYYEKVEQEARAITRQDTTDAHVRVIDGRIYVIRNLYTTTKYTKFGTLVLELNKDKLIDGIYLNKDYELAFYVNDTGSMITYDSRLLQEEPQGMIEKLKTRYSRNINRRVIEEHDKPFIGMIYQQKYDDFHFGAILIVNEKLIFSELQVLYGVMFLIMLVIVPIFLYMIYFISHHITKPMGIMVEAARSLEKGDIGRQVVGKSMPNTEFEVLKSSFNQMSSEIKYLFDYAYSEKLARKDAKIIALQSQINPHFLNNTLEMMNWQARMAGDMTVSKMIEALGTLLNYSMDRSNRKMISLAEELRCVDAYCYIISMRFGKRLKIEKEVDQELLRIEVPQLILQPLIENAVVHGVETVKSGTIWIRVFKEKENAILQIVNTGNPMTEEDVVRVRHILEGNQEQQGEEASPDRGPLRRTGKGRHEAMGVFNVNERIKLIYGEEYGLTIGPLAGGETASTITIPVEYDPDRVNLSKPSLLWNRSDI
ncbi:two-component system sensor histidine kinase YesM [Anaerotaenia torta]|uniref:sensor histidine kinase n=1 Tax=Anaerotaenia torta TaxID=433293 RepID=UPI003D1FC103